MDLSLFSITEGCHKNKNVIWIGFEKNNEHIILIKQNLNVRWSNSQKSWYVLDNNFNRKILGLEQKIIGKDILSKIAPINLNALKRLENELKLKVYSHNTIKTYIVEFAQLLYILKNNSVNDLTPERLKSYLLYCISTLKITESHLQSRINAIKFYYEKVLKRERFFFDIPRPKKSKLLPKVIGTTDIKKIFKVIDNQKHLVMIKLCYGMGLRVSEVTNLEIKDIDSGRMQVHIRSAKGKKDRYVPLPKSVLDDLKMYYKAYKPKRFLFEGQYGGQYSVRSVQSVYKKALEKAKINKDIGIHGLRHSYATHLIEMGTDVTLIKELLGHNDVKTTLLYTHVSQKNIRNVESPLDKL